MNGGMGDVGMMGDVPSDYGPPYSGQVMVPYAKGPLGALPLIGKAKARAQFLTWLQDWNPSLFQAALNRAEDWKATLPSPTALSGLADTTDTTSEPTTWWQQMAGAVTSLGTAYLAYKGQEDVLQTNIQRAQLGLPPINPATGAPQVNVGLSPQLTARLQDTGSLLLYGALGIGGLFLVLNLFKGRGRR